MVGKLDKKTFWACFSVVMLLLVVGGFFLTTYLVAQGHEQTMVEEWQSWGTAIADFFKNIGKKAVEESEKIISVIK